MREVLAADRVQMPELDAETGEAWSLWHALGRDANGSPLLSEQRELLDEYEVADPDTRELLRHLWMVVTSVHGECQEDDFEAKKVER